MTLFHYVRLFHIMNGTLALIIAPLAMVTVKGGRWHRRWGKTYFWAMAGVALTAVVMCWLQSGLFLFLIAIFSFYLALTGYRVLWRKQLKDKPTLFDWCAALAMALAGIGLVLPAAFGGDKDKQWVRIVFGIISLYLGAWDIFRFFKPSQNKTSWLSVHMTRFLGAYVATVTAFSAVNFRFLPYVWRWLWPTVLGTAGILMWRRYYMGKLKLKGDLSSPSPDHV